MRIVCFSAVLCAASLAQAATAVDGLYAGVFAGYSYVPNNISNTTNNVLRTQSAYNSGYNAGLRFGYQSNPLRYEGEYTYIQAQSSGFQINYVPQSGVTGSMSASYVLANIYYDFPEMLPSIAPYLGIGVGYAYLESSLNSTGPAGNTEFSVSDNAFAYQATAGLSYNFAENYAANLAYRYISTDRVANFGEVVQAHLASAGVTYRFDQGNYK